MKSLKGRFIQTNIFMVIISAVLVLIVSLLLLFLFSVSEQDGFTYIIEGFREMFSGDFGVENSLVLYVLAWAALVGVLILITCILLSANLSRAVLGPVKDLQRAAENIAEGNLDFEVLGCDDQELNELCHSFDQIRKKLKENALKELRVQEERNMLIANLSHDMRTPITSIKGYLEGIRDGVADSPEKTSRYLDTIYSKTLILEQMLDNITEYSELELGRMQYAFEYVDLTSYLKDWIEDYKMDIKEQGLQVRVNLIERPLMVVADRSKLKRVLDNLISNAVKYNKENGEVSIKTETDNKGALLCISDSGIGIKENDSKKVFDGFYRGDVSRSNIKGNGLGLAISKQIVESHRGKIWIKSIENVGTDVFIYLPLREREWQ
ncbi:MAG: HAMP domain-containing sensor histidine kinase [Eubacteriales bacterium]|nr:HAMP domain-containing sensor histidine kinase [Eubacteriales bacterium]